MRIDLNSDVGESFGAYTIGHDAGLMTSITSANVAAGFHGGDPTVLRNTVGSPPWKPAATFADVIDVISPASWPMV